MALYGFMQFFNVKGNSSNEKHKNWFHIDSFTFGIQSELKNLFQDSLHHGNFSQINITRKVDEASSQLMACTAAKDIADCSLTFSKSMSDDAPPLIKVNLKNAQITSYNMELTSKGSVEHLSFHYSEIYFEYSPTCEANRQMPGYSFQCHLES